VAGGGIFGVSPKRCEACQSPVSFSSNTCMRPPTTYRPDAGSLGWSACVSDTGFYRLVSMVGPSRRLPRVFEAMAARLWAIQRELTISSAWPRRSIESRMFGFPLRPPQAHVQRFLVLNSLPSDVSVARA
jgi:hypothetical protein